MTLTMTPPTHLQGPETLIKRFAEQVRTSAARVLLLKEDLGLVECG